MSDAEENDIPMAECGSCRAIIPLDSKDCPECGISFSGVSDEALGECGACNSLVPLDSKSCPECGVYFVADEVLDVLRDWFNNTGIDAKVLFAKFDSDSDGSIDADELRDGLLKLNLADLPPSQIDRLISEVDDDEDGVISLEELVTAINGDESPEDDKFDDDKAESKLQYSENVVQRVMEKFEISDKDEFLLYAKQFDENENDYLTEAELKSAAESYIAEQSTNESNKEIIETEAGTNESVIEEDDLDVEEETVDESDELDESTESSTEQVDSEDEEVVSEGEKDGLTSDEVADSIAEDVEPNNLDAQDEDLTAEDYLGILLDAAQEQNLTIRDIFESMDLDEDGVIDGPELQSGISEIAGEYLST